jgi:23S rRNA (pseudouridine1915-N3)-methyltransferase
MKVNVLVVSDSDKHFSTAIAEYTKRLWNDIRIIEIKPEKNGSREQIITKETQKIIEKLETIKDSYNILLAKEWKNISTEQFVWSIKKYNTLTFIIWWPYGINIDLCKPYIKEYIAFGSITMPHGLAKLVLLEQVYRAKTIIEGREYHY